MVYVRTHIDITRRTIPPGFCIAGVECQHSPHHFPDLRVAKFSVQYMKSRIEKHKAKKSSDNPGHCFNEPGILRQLIVYSREAHGLPRHRCGAAEYSARNGKAQAKASVKRKGCVRTACGMIAPRKKAPKIFSCEKMVALFLHLLLPLGLCLARLHS